jgi:hypothetical protein
VIFIVFRFFQKRWARSNDLFNIEQTGQKIAKIEALSSLLVSRLTIGVAFFFGDSKLNHFSIMLVYGGESEVFSEIVQEGLP